MTCHCRIISPERKRAAWGPESQMRVSFNTICVQLSTNRWGLRLSRPCGNPVQIDGEGGI